MTADLIKESENSEDEEFKQLEKVNADIDVLIDEERYGEVEKTLYDLNLDIKALSVDCFKDDTCSATKPAKNAWKLVLSPLGDGHIPILSVHELALNDPIRKYWAYLLHAKLLRAKIMQKGTDCYYDKLNGVVAYLERNLPPLSDDEDGGQFLTRLHVLYLLELSECGEWTESLGFAERARRVLRNNKKLDEPFVNFYDLWARYNVGVAYFHMGRHRKAVLEFDFIIWRLRSSVNPQIDYFKNKEGNNLNNDLLLYPAITYRADIQLKLQLAYHALNTIHKYIADDIGHPSDYRKTWLELIKAQAYQMMDRTDKSAESLKELHRMLFNCDLEGDLRPNGDSPPSVTIPNIKQTRSKRNAEARYVGLLIDYHLNFLRGRSDRWGQEHKAYLRELKNKIIQNAYGWFKSESPNRKGFAEQWAEYLGWLSRSKVFDVADELYEDGDLGKKFLQQTPGEMDKRNEVMIDASDCSFCSDETIDLQRLQPEHYDDFRDNVWQFFVNRESSNTEDKDREKAFIMRLMKLERRREDLRINDLELRYKGDRSQAGSALKGCSKEMPCWAKGDADVRGFSGVLRCHGCERSGTGDSSNTQDNLASRVNPALTHSARDYEKIMSDWDESFDRQLRYGSYHAEYEDGVYFLGLRRWNSSSPAKGFSLGGGYFIYQIKDKKVILGIAVDPGFDFMRNLFHAGFSLHDIDIILISHAHVDHLRDYESIVNLMFELNKRTEQVRRVHTLMTLGIYRRLEYIIESPTLREFIEPYIIDIEKEVDDNFFENLADPTKDITKFEFELIESVESTENHRRLWAKVPGSNTSRPAVTIKPTRAYHQDHSGYSDSFGYIIEVTPTNLENVVIGYTGDTKWVEEELLDDPLVVPKRRIEIISQYRNTDALIVHMGSLIDKEKGEAEADKRYSFDFYAPGNDNRCEKLIRGKNHPYLIGLLRLVSSLCNNSDSQSRNKLVLLGEFGEELRGGIRVDLVRRLLQTFNGAGLTFVPVDVGVNIQLKCRSGKSGEKNPAKNAESILCTQCNRFVNIIGQKPLEANIQFEAYGVDEGLYCICNTCQKALPHDVVQDRLRRLSEIGYEFHTR
jgi:ribonuclease BN (tRNA processing enzyme)